MSPSFYTVKNWTFFVINPICQLVCWLGIFISILFRTRFSICTPVWEFWRATKSKLLVLYNIYRPIYNIYRPTILAFLSLRFVDLRNKLFCLSLLIFFIHSRHSVFNHILNCQYVCLNCQHSTIFHSTVHYPPVNQPTLYIWAVSNYILYM